MFLLINNLIKIWYDKASYQFDSRGKDNEIGDIYKKGSIPFNEYEFFNNKFKILFGLNYALSDKSYYQDLIQINDLWSIK